ncbi:restriction endonuclease subunit S [Bordetella bronchiseptica]|uniref:restriction endonuclease subunit S n=1 Tax=Bordetella bronchiseptica TaxID=518 RepID=UPI001F45E3F2|nr:restriction endonuclease subunit S [Bordetella bronchiseptica]
MSNKEKSVMHTEKDDATMLPRLRFPEFRDSGDWTVVPLGKIAEILSEKAGSRKLTLFSITSGVGLVSQIEKFGREIAGAQYKNYYVIHPNDFAYNKSATKDFPEGFIACHQGAEPGAVPNSIFTCFRVRPGVSYPPLLNYQFANNLHGKWLRRFITVGARAHGSLNVDDDDLLATPVPVPPLATRIAEQRKIADCLSSLDDLIAAECQRLERLQTHRAVLMQRILPCNGESAPRMRFPEFRERGPWRNKTLSQIAEIRSGSTPSRAESAFYSGGTIPWVKTTDLNNGFIARTEECITPAARARVNPAGSVLVAMYGGFKQIGRTGYLTLPAATNQAISVLNADENEVLPIYLLTWMNARVGDWKRIASSSRKDPNITGTDVANFPISYPDKDEQQKIADAVTTVNDGIEAQGNRIVSLKEHKVGLLQQLFPATSEVSE